jgi:hypothetical protein
MPASGALPATPSCALAPGRSGAPSPLLSARVGCYRKLLSALRLGPRYRLVLVEPDGAGLAKVGQLVEQGKVKPVIDRVLPLEQVRWVLAAGPGPFRRLALHLPVSVPRHEECSWPRWESSKLHWVRCGRNPG